jgi:hypothetical protein
MVPTGSGWDIFPEVERLINLESEAMVIDGDDLDKLEKYQIPSGHRHGSMAGSINARFGLL